jgi:signal transduction histidine kinase
MDYSLLDLASLAVFTFGALAFATLTVFYWGERRRRPGKPTVFPAFTLVCAAAFVSNLLLQVLNPPLTSKAVLVRDLTTGLIPLLILHVVFEAESRSLAKPRLWRGILAAVYSGGAGSALLRGLDESGLVTIPWGEPLYRAPAATLAVASALGLLLPAFSSRPLTPGERAHRAWVRALLLLMLICALVNLASLGAYIGPVADYLLLAFFCVTLYYRERLVFFDLLVKRGAFLAVGLVILAAGFAIRQPAILNPWACAFVLVFWLTGPWVYALVSRIIDHVWLHRPYSPPEAERQFIRDIQGAATEEELRAHAAQSLGAIFQAPAYVRFDNSVASNPHPDSLAAEFICLGARPNGTPFLSDDRRLLRPLAGALAVVLENVRFRVERRAQEQREQQLRWLASRAELKALRAQINPHFLFNALSVIAGLVHYRPERADEAIEQLAQVFRYTLHKSETEWGPLSEEVEFVTAYLRIEQARFGERLRVTFDVDPAAGSISIPAMSIQPLIENAVRHGVSAVEGRGTVGLRAALEGGMLSVEVTDSGPGFPPDFCLQDDSDGHGLRNVMERLRGYYGDAARLSWESGRNGTRVVLTLPPGEHARDTCSDCG